MDCCEIRRILPHRYPFLLVDRIASIDIGTRCIGEKNVTLNEPCFNNIVDAAGTDALRYPVALQLESFAQVGALLVLASRARIDVDQEYVMLAGSVRGMKILRDVLPGEILLHHVSIVKEIKDTVVIGGEIRTIRPGATESIGVAEIESVVIAVRPREGLFPPKETRQ